MSPTLGHAPFAATPTGSLPRDPTDPIHTMWIEPSARRVRALIAGVPVGRGRRPATATAFNAARMHAARYTTTFSTLTAAGLDHAVLVGSPIALVLGGYAHRSQVH